MPKKKPEEAKLISQPEFKRALSKVLKTSKQESDGQIVECF